MSVGDVQQMFSSIIFLDILRFMRGLPVENGKEKGVRGRNVRNCVMAPTGLKMGDTPVRAIYHE